MLDVFSRFVDRSLFRHAASLLLLAVVNVVPVNRAFTSHFFCAEYSN